MLEGSTIIVSPFSTSETRTFEGRTPLIYRRRVETVQGQGPQRAMQVFVFTNEIFWRFEDTGETFKTHAFFRKHAWFYPLDLAPWEVSLAPLLPPTYDEPLAYMPKV